MTLLEVKKQVANYLDRDITDLTVNGVDMFIEAANQVRKSAEQLHDFEFSRRLVSLSVDGVTGGNLEAAVLQSDGVTSVNVKTVIDVGMFDSSGNLRPCEWTTVSESLQRIREDVSQAWMPRYPTDAEFEREIGNGQRFTLSGSQIFKFPKDSTNDYSLGLEVYSYQDDWNVASLGSETAVVSGTLSPNITGTYYQAGEINSKPLYIKANATSIYALLYVPAGTEWILADIQDSGFPSTVATNDAWIKSGDTTTPDGTYTPGGTVTGTATVTSYYSTEDIWTTQGAQYLIWGTVVLLNHRFKHFVYRQEGNLPPPEKLRDEGLQSLITWDSAKFDLYRQHGRV